MSVICHIFVGLAVDLRTILIGRYMSGFFGSASIAIIPRVAFDICDTTERAISVVTYVTALSLGPILGVVVGEFTLLVPTSNWRWTIWAAAIAGVLSISIVLVAIPGTDRQIIRATRAVRHQSNRQQKRDPTTGQVAGDCQVSETCPQGSRKVVRSPKQIAIAVCAILVYGVLHMLLLVYPMSFEIDRACPFGISSLPFLAVIAGLIIGGVRLAWEAIQSKSGRREQAWTTCPENSLNVMVSGSYTLATGLFIFAWTSHRDTNSWPQISSGILTGYGIILVLAPALVSLVDASSADMFTLSAYACLQSSAASVSPLLVMPMYKMLGVRSASNLLATVCLAVALALSFLYRQTKN